MGKDLKGKEIGKGFSQKKDGRYVYRIMVNGERIEYSNTSLTKLRRESRRSPYEEDNKSKDGTFNEWYEKWLKDYKLPSLKNGNQYIVFPFKLVRNFQQDLGEKRLGHIRACDILKSINRQRSTYAPITIRTNYGILNEFLDTAVKEGVIKKNPCEGLKPNFGMVPPTERRVMSLEEEREFLQIVKGTYYEDLFYTLLMTGMRFGEVSGLEVKDIDFKKKVIHIRKQLLRTKKNGVSDYDFMPPKSMKGYRDIPFIGDIEIHLRRQLAKENRPKKEKFKNLVFYSRNNMPLSKTSIKWTIDSYVGKINKKRQEEQGDDYEEFEPIHPHTFRHTFCTRLFENGVNPVVIQRIMGHSSYSTTLSYTHTNENLVKNELKKITKIV